MIRDPAGECRDRGRLGWLLSLRSSVLEAVREYFRHQGFVEVETPAAVPAPSLDAHLEPVGLDCGAGWLITSPEYHMKRLLALGSPPKIYQICRCFRGGDHSPSHRPEFVMVEWYRAHAGPDRVLADVECLLSEAARKVNGGSFGRSPAGLRVDLTPPWPRLTVAAAFERHAGIPRDCLLDGGATSLREGARAAGCDSVEDGDDWETAFHKLLVERVEPALADMGQGVHLTGYPAPLAALARLDGKDPRLSERFESYAGGLELANGFGELTDPRQQRRRFRVERLRRRREKRRELPLDEEFLRDLTSMPEASGVALGLDRLVMLLCGAQRIGEVAAF